MHTSIVNHAEDTDYNKTQSHQQQRGRHADADHRADVLLLLRGRRLGLLGAGLRFHAGRRRLLLRASRRRIIFVFSKF